MAHGLSCSMACGIFPDQGSNPCLLHWQVDSLPLSHLSTAFVKNTSCVPLGNFTSSLRFDVHIYTTGVRSAYFADCAEGNSGTQSTRGGTWQEATAVQREKEDCAEPWTMCVCAGLDRGHLTFTPYFPPPFLLPWKRALSMVAAPKL